MGLLALVFLIRQGTQEVPQEVTLKTGLRRPSLEEKTFSYPEGDFHLLKLGPYKRDRKDRVSIFVPGDHLQLAYYPDQDQDLKLVDYQDEDLSLPLDSPLYVIGEEDYLAISQALSFSQLDEANLVKEEDTRPVEVDRVRGGFLLKYTYPLEEGAQGILWYLSSKEALVQEGDREAYGREDLYETGVLYFDGYYYQTDKTYKPYAPQAYFRIPSPYLARHHLSYLDRPLSRIFSRVLLDLTLDHINEAGFFPVEVESGWLKGDYGIPSGYYDNRWNTDLAHCLLKGYQEFKDPAYQAAYRKIIAYTLSHNQAHHKTLMGPEGQEGYLVDDYSHPGQESQTHTSLNHQLAVINLLLDAYGQEGREDYLREAQGLLRGIEILGPKWIKEDQDLHYAYLVDGSLGLLDYPRLTLNDLLLTQELLEKTGQARSSVLDQLIQSKEAYLKSKGL